MDASSRLERLEFILGKQRVKASELDPGEWWALIEVIHARFKPRLQYLQFPYCWNPLRQYLNHRAYDVGEESGYDFWVTEAKQTELPAGLNLDTRCERMATMIERPQHNPRHEAAEKLAKGELSPVMFRRDILLTQKGRWIEWHAKHILKLEKWPDECHQNDWYKENRPCIKAVAEFSRFRYLDADELRSIMNTRIGQMLFSRFDFMIHRAIEEKQQRVADLRSLGTDLSSIRSRLDMEYILR